MRQCKVFNNGIPIGTLKEDTDGYSFRYDPEYLSAAGATALCLAMPLSSETYVSSALFPFFVNMLPEGVNRSFLTKLFHLSPDDDFGLLLKSADKDTIGAISVEEL